MINSLKKYDSLRSVIDRCNDVVLGILGSSRVREAGIAAESFKNGGKRLRPILMILSSTAAGKSRSTEAPTPLIELAAAVELIHLATLFHDDVIDEVDSRRMKPSARVKYGNFVSVLAGDYVLSEALLLVDRSGVQNTLPEFLKTIRVLVSGESLETNHKFDFDMSEDTYFDIISEKSASLFALSCKVGGMFARSGHADLLGRCGWNLGMAFQMIDDLDDMLDLPNGTMDCDLRNGYLALPVIHALNSLRDGHRHDLIELIRRGDYSAQEERLIATLCNEHGGIQHTNDEIERHLNQAAEGIAALAPNEATEFLQQIVADLRAYTRRQVSGFSIFCGAHTQSK
ncbi:MAG: polyprenyl synthetase family protein [Candidatus Krumholzibacteria bacterium]|nr:polyprenyl synthetase family protein [Candidatus Krumholzibacteria bacterium]